MQFSNDNFESEVLKSNLPVLVDFFAVWCGPCQAAAPVIDELAKEYKGKMKIGKLDIDQNRETALRYNVMSIPTLIIFKKGKEVKRLVGFPGKEGLKNLIEEII